MARQRQSGLTRLGQSAHCSSCGTAQAGLRTGLQTGLHAAITTPLQQDHSTSKCASVGWERMAGTQRGRKLRIWLVGYEEGEQGGPRGRAGRRAGPACCALRAASPVTYSWSSCWARSLSSWRIDSCCRREISMARCSRRRASARCASRMSSACRASSSCFASRLSVCCRACLAAGRASSVPADKWRSRERRITRATQTSQPRASHFAGLSLSEP